MTTVVPSILDIDLPFVDLEDATLRADPHAVFRRLLPTSPIIRTHKGLEVLELDWIREIQSDERMITGGYTTMVRPDGTSQIPFVDAFREHGLLVALSGEKHRRIRKVQAKAFALRRVDSLRDMINGVANSVLDNFIDAGEADFVWDFTHLYSISVLCRTIGIPVEDIPLFDHDTLAVAHSQDRPEEANVGLRNLHDYVQKLVAVRREALTDDLVSGMITAQETDGHLSEEELIWNIVNLMFAGHDTTRFQLALLGKTLVAQGVWDKIGNSPELVPAALIEGIRMDPIVPNPPARITTEDVEFHDMLIPKGTLLNLNMHAASRDPHYFPNPDTFDLNRTGLMFDQFGHGLHYCLGFGLATVEMEEALRVLTSRITNIKVISEDTERYPSKGSILGPRSLKITFRKR